MQIFYAPGITGNSYTLDEKESRHCVKVLRLKRDTPVRLIDGLGNLYEGVISDADPDECGIAIHKVIRNYEKRPYRLHIAISPLKNPERFEWFIEKSVEIGVDEISPVICNNTEKQGLKKERINNIIISAMKQSLKASLPRLNELSSFKDFINSTLTGTKMIAHCNADFDRKAISSVYNRGEEAIIMIGPEGDFTPEEIKIAIKEGYASVHLGMSRLRTETAGIAACHSISFINIHS